ncbi:hypothetical protein FRB95_002600 [Tulasnella sp. JGI-2019a]|nr:hypothetical protein FRB95_002600 [Tulasnella sp. JGI-2019a]
MAPQTLLLPRTEAIAAIQSSKREHDQFNKLHPPATLNPGPFVEFTGYKGPPMKEALQRIEAGNLTPAEQLIRLRKEAGDLALKQGRYSEAVAHYEAVTVPGTARNPYSLACYGNHCQALMYLKRWGEALELYDVAIFHFIELHGAQTNSPVLQALHLKGGTIHMNLGYFEKAHRLLMLAVSIGPSNEPARAELKYVEGLIRNNREKYGEDRRAELEGRTKENANFGLNREEIELLWECNIMPWDDYVDDYLDAARGLDEDGEEEEEEDNLPGTPLANLSSLKTALGSLEESDTMEASNSSGIANNHAESLFEQASAQPRQRKHTKGPSSSQAGMTKSSGPHTRHDLTQCQQCWVSKSEGDRFRKCAKCLTAIYCSKECQRAHWKIHKSQCAIKAQSLKNPGPAIESTSADLMKQMREFTGKHRPTLAKGLTYAIDLHIDRDAYEHKVLFVGLTHQPNATHAGKKFKVVVAESMDIDQLLAMDGINKSAAALPEQLKIMSAEAKKTGMLGTGAIVLVTVTVAHGVGTLIMPVSLHGPWVLGADAPPLGWKAAMVEELNKD